MQGEGREEREGGKRGEEEEEREKAHSLCILIWYECRLVNYICQYHFNLPLN